nr:MAG TPA: tail completion protein [Caudoviricetes sp.]
MGTRLELQSKLEELLGCKHVYYQPPESVKMEYPAIRYSKKSIAVDHADDTAYLKNKSYELIVISRKPDEPVIEKLLDLPYCSFNTSYKADNLYHDSLTLYF